MGTIIENRSLDWVTAPGDEITLCNCPPPPGCSSSDYLSSTWLKSTESTLVEEVAVPGGDPNAVSDQEKALFRTYARQSLVINLGGSLRAAEAALSTTLADADITLSENAIRIMSKAFKLRADWTKPPASS